jgi:hypothetical protein
MMRLKIRLAAPSVSSRLLGTALSVALYAAFTPQALAADHPIGSGTASFDCSRVSPGDTLTLAAGARGPLKITNCQGAEGKRIVIRNDARGSGPAIVRRDSGSGGGFVFSCVNCIYVDIDGSPKWQGAPAGKTYGIKVTMTGGGSPSAFFRVSGLSRFVTIRNVEVDGTWPALGTDGIGISVNDHQVKRADHPGLWREGILIENCYVHNVQGEGMYVGPNYREGDLPLRNIEIRYNRVEDTGWEGINTKSMWAGNNSVHHNVVIRAGSNGSLVNKPTQYSGINNNAGTLKIYNNWVEKTGQHGIQVWNADGPMSNEGIGPFTVSIWNNVIVDAGALWKSHMADSYGINVGAADGTEKPVPTIYNNTIVDSRLSAIRLTRNVGNGIVRDNIVANAGSNPISVPANVTLANNEVGSITQMAFVDPTRFNFRLATGSPARNRGGSGFPQTDFDDVARPQDGAPDLGAFEGNDGQQSAARPNAPDSVVVE